MLHATISRRAVLAGGAMGLLGACAARSPAPARAFFDAAGLPVGVQLFSVMTQVQADLEGTLAALGRIGYRSVEMAGLMGHSAPAIRAALDRAGLKCTSAHVPARSPRPGDTLTGDLGIIAEQARVIGFDTVIMPLFYIPDRFELKPRSGETGAQLVHRLAQQFTVDDWKYTVDFLNARGRDFRRLGLRFGYHNHNIEFMPVGGTTPMEMILSGTDPDLVTVEMDVGWITAAGLDPVAFMARHPGRFTAMHVKDVAPTTRPNFAASIDSAEIGSGIVDWRRLLPAARTAGITRFFVEQEPPFVRPPLEALKQGYDFLSGVPT